MTGEWLAIIMFAVFLENIRYTVPWASGAPPRSAPAMYQLLKTTGDHPNTVVKPSVKVPTPYIAIPIDHQNR